MTMIVTEYGRERYRIATVGFAPHVTFGCLKAGNDEKSVNGIIINSGIVGSATEKWDQDLQ